MENSQIEFRINNLIAKQKRLDKKIAKLKRKIKITCGKCEKSYIIGDIEYIQTHWYVQPYSCSGGDYWNTGEGQWNCPDCKFNNRLYDKPEIEKLKYNFKSIVKVY